MSRKSAMNSFIKTVKIKKVVTKSWGCPTTHESGEEKEFLEDFLNDSFLHLLLMKILNEAELIEKQWKYCNDL